MKRFKNILASIDSRADVHPALEWAAQLAEDNAAKLKIIDVLPEFPAPVRLALDDCDHVYELLFREKQERLEELAASLRGRGMDVTAKLLCGQTSVEIIREVLREQHDLVVRVSKGPQSRRAGFFGTTTFRLLRKCPCPVWIVKPNTAPRFRKLVGAVDPFAHDDKHRSLNVDIVELVRSIAQTEHGRFDIIHVWAIYGEELLRSRMHGDEFRELERDARQEVERALDALLSKHGLTIQDENVRLIRGEPASAIPQFIEEKDVDLLVIGTIGRSGIAGFIMGNIAEQILNRVQCAVLALKPAGFISPITVDGPTVSAGV